MFFVSKVFLGRWPIVFSKKNLGRRRSRLFFFSSGRRRPFFFLGLAIYIEIKKKSEDRQYASGVKNGKIVGNLFAFVVLFFMGEMFRRPRAFFEGKKNKLNKANKGKTLKFWGQVKS